MKSALALMIVAFSSALLWSQTPLVHAHAHNDYEHDRPLLDALHNGFVSVEADVHAIDGRLYVVHDRPNDLTGVPTLEDAYLKPLMERAQLYRGKIFPGYQGFFYLMIDIKTSAEQTYPLLRDELAKYEAMLSVVENDEDQPQKAVKVFISGNRPFEQLERDQVKYAGLDGRPGDLPSAYSAAMMPVISDHYRRFFASRDLEEIQPEEVIKLKAMVQQAHSEGRRVRLWAIPDHPDMWRFLRSLDVDLINTDHLSELREFFVAEGD
ncbi:MAG: hypothetical protein AAGA85_15020 [Bacteroidota bacterium]